MEVIRAATAGFCMGVDMALNKLDRLIEDCPDQDIFILGPIIHNPQVLERYKAKGVVTARKPEDVKSGSAVVIRAHGVPRSVEQGLKGRGVKIIDATCPRVKKAQLLIQRHCRDGRKLLLYGEEEHPEVAGLMSYAESEPFVFGEAEELEKYPLKNDEQYALAAQTTQDRIIFNQMAERLKAMPDLDIVILETICDATRLRQEEAVRLAGAVDYMVVVGGFMSGNTRRLAQVAQAQGTPCVHVEDVSELPLDEIRKYKKIGLTAGASTPKDLVDAIETTLRDL